MPFIRKTPRRPLRHVVKLSRLTLANWQVIGEMEHLGLSCGGMPGMMADV